MWIHGERCAWLAALLTVVFLVELSGVVRIADVSLLLSLTLILLVGFFSARWYAGFLALWLVIISLVLAPFWVLDMGAAALVALGLLAVAPFFTGRRFLDFGLLLGVGSVLLAATGSWVHGGPNLGIIALSLAANLMVGSVFFLILDTQLPHRDTVATK